MSDESAAYLGRRFHELVSKGRRKMFDNPSLREDREALEILNKILDLPVARRLPILKITEHGFENNTILHKIVNLQDEAFLTGALKGVSISQKMELFGIMNNRSKNIWHQILCLDDVRISLWPIKTAFMKLGLEGVGSDAAAVKRKLTDFAAKGEYGDTVWKEIDHLHHWESKQERGQMPALMKLALEGVAASDSIDILHKIAFRLDHPLRDLSIYLPIIEEKETTIRPYGLSKGSVFGGEKLVIKRDNYLDWKATELYAADGTHLMARYSKDPRFNMPVVNNMIEDLAELDMHSRLVAGAVSNVAKDKSQATLVQKQKQKDSKLKKIEKYNEEQLVNKARRHRLLRLDILSCYNK